MNKYIGYREDLENDFEDAIDSLRELSADIDCIFIKGAEKEIDELYSMLDRVKKLKEIFLKALDNNNELKNKKVK